MKKKKLDWQVRIQVKVAPVPRLRALRRALHSERGWRLEAARGCVRA